MTHAENTAMAVRHVEAGPGDAGQRVDNFLLRVLKGVPRSHIYRLLRRGEVRVNGGRAKPEQRLAEGDSVRLPPVRMAAEEAPGTVPAGLRAAVRQSIVHEDERVVVIDKPAGLAVHGGSGLSFGVIEALRADRPGQELELAHRLDRDTSGLLAIAKDRGSLRILHALLREGGVQKTYLALLAGRWTLGKKTIDAPLATHTRQGGERTVTVHVEGKPSASTFRPIERFAAEATLVEVDIHTGRTHQIRVHAAFAGHPVAGDPKYGDREFNARMKARGLERMFLHAHALSFTWPDTGRKCRFVAALPAELKAVLAQLGQGATRRK
ncbi:MAG: RluA family pseudouridine synthase [Steroidobacteraceae bacterium]|jgi:23S rRNA pseudouridine955/2504/2580 synthase|nr:RluA family pseudouridine synthase [Steroidobacteraceae bacterium]